MAHTPRGTCKWCGKHVTWDSMGQAWYDRTDAVGCSHAPWFGFKYMRQHEVD